MMEMSMWVNCESLPTLYPEAYLSGVLKGDGYCTKVMGLLVKDRDFADTFVLAIYKAYQVRVTPHLHRGKYWYSRIGNHTGRYTYLLSLRHESIGEKAAWLRGLFDSEGNAQLTKMDRGTNSYWRRVSMYSTNTDTLNRAHVYLQSLEIASVIRLTKNSQTHKGDKLVYELTIKAGKENYGRFLSRVGSSIARKQSTLETIVQGYVPDLSAAHKQGQLKGASAKHKKTMEVTLPRVVRDIKQLISQGIKPTYENCRSIPSYGGVYPHVSGHAELVRMALELGE